MPADDEALIRDFYEGFASRDHALLVRHVSRNVEFHNPEYAIEPGVRYGVEEFVGVVERMHEMFEFRAIETQRWERTGDRIAVAYNAQLRARGSGAPLDTDFGHTLTLREGKVVRLEWFRTYDEALAAARAGSPNLELVRGLYRAWEAGDLDAALAGLAPDIEWVEPVDTPDGQSWRGPEGVLASMAEWTEPFDEYRIELLEELDLGDQVLVGVLQSGRGKASGVAVESEVWHLWTLRDGKAVRAEMFRTRADALQATAAPRSESRPVGPA
jgi:ketosteroid isomerase-like protein